MKVRLKTGWSIAHEVAHFLLGHQIPIEVIVDEGAPAPFSAHQEREADVFATEYLMPAAWVAPCAVTPISLSAVHEIAQTFRAWLVASAVRL